jgi:hypothetical protein
LCARSLCLAARLLVVRIAPALLCLCRASGHGISTRLLVSRSHWLSLCARSIPLCVETTRLAAAMNLLRLRRATGCLGMSHSSSRGSSLTTLPRAARRRLLHLRRASGCLGTSCGSSSATLPTPRVRVPRHVARLVVNYFARLRPVVDYFAYAARPGASTRRAARRRLLCLRLASGCLGTSRGSSSTTRCLAARLLVGRSHWLSPCARSLRLAVRLLCAPPLDLLSGHTGSTSTMLCVVTTCLTATPTLLRARRAPPRRRLPVASRRPLIWTSFPN